MIDITELKGTNLKKDLKLDRALKRWHNKNKSGGNFGINLYQKDDKPDYQITGYHNLNGDVTGLSVAQLYQAGPTIFSKGEHSEWNYPKLIKFLTKILAREKELHWQDDIWGVNK